MKETAITTMILITLALVAVTGILIVRDINLYNTVNRQQEELDAYSHYYSSTETMLDSIEADGYEVQVMLEHEAGAKYLDDKYVLDSLLFN